MLCNQPNLELYHQDKGREYWQCQYCQLVQVPSAFHLTPEQEKVEYDKHDNQEDDLGYRRFLSRCLSPVLERIKIELLGLDYGCGEGKVLSKMAQEAGITINNYDLYYANDKGVLDLCYDFITATEVIEHIYDAKALFEQFDSLLKPQGFMALMTKRVLNLDAFTLWHYKNDPTHICFYSIETFEWIASHYGWQLEVISNDVVILRK